MSKEVSNLDGDNESVTTLDSSNKSVATLDGNNQSGGMYESLSSSSDSDEDSTDKTLEFSKRYACFVQLSNITLVRGVYRHPRHQPRRVLN